MEKRLITKIIGIDCAHRVPNHWSKCKHLHWHRYKIIVTCIGKVITEIGHPAEWMLVDFSDLKKFMLEEIDARYDHWSVFYKWDPICSIIEDLENEWHQNKGKIHFVDFIPTAENLAKHWAELIIPRIKKTFNNDLEFKQIEVFETPTSTAIYTI